MVGGEEPDGMQSFYQRREAMAAGPPDLTADHSPVDLGPPLPDWKINWRGVGALVVVVLALGVVSRLFGPSVAAIVGVAALLSAAIWTIGKGTSPLHQGVDAVGGEFGGLGTGMDCGDFAGGGGGDC